MSDDKWDEINRVTLDYIANSEYFRDWISLYFRERPFERAIREGWELNMWAERERKIGR